MKTLTRCLKLCGVAALVVSFLFLGSSVKAGNEPVKQLAQPLEGPDVVGGYASTHVIVRAKPGVKPKIRADGRWTFTKPASAKNGKLGANEGVASNRAVADVLHECRVNSISSLCGHAFEHKDSASQLGLDRYYKVSVPVGSDAPAVVKALQKLSDRFELVELDGIGSIALIPNDADFEEQWNMNNTGQTAGSSDADIDAPEAWNLHKGSPAITIAILDTGVQADHPELAGRVVSGWNTRDENSDTSDENGHGTHCAGIAAAAGNNGIGIAGTNWNVTILAYRVTTAGGAGFASDCAEAVILATDAGADIISMSLQFYDNVTSLGVAVEYAFNNGVLLIAATGNNKPPGTIAYPAKFDNCMGIGATDHNDGHPSFSNNGPEIDVCAPGDDVYSLSNNSGYGIRSGTSMATPHVSGLAALMMSYIPCLTNAQIEQIIKGTADDLGTPGWDTLFGHGRVNAFEALYAYAGDMDCDGIVNVDDLLQLLSQWGTCPSLPSFCPGDLNSDGFVNVNDLIFQIGNWGEWP